MDTVIKILISLATLHWETRWKDLWKEKKSSTSVNSELSF